MRYADCPSGRRLPAIAVTLALHIAVIALAATVFGVTPGGKGAPGTPLVAVFTAPPPEPPLAEAPAPEADRPAKPPKPQAARRAQAAPPQVERLPPAMPGPSAPAHLAPSMQPLAQPRPVASPEHAAPATPPGDQAQAGELAAYTALLRDRIARRRPRGLRKQGAAVIAFRLDGAGALVSSDIVESSGDIRLDRLALRMLRQAAPFPAPPENLSQSSLSFRLPVRFH